MDVSASGEGCLALRAGARSPGLCLGTHRRGALSSHLPLVTLQRLVVEQAARGSSPPDLRLQYLHQMQANHEVRPFGGPCPEPSTLRGSTGVTHTGTCVSPSLAGPPSPLSPESGLGSCCRGQMRAEHLAKLRGFCRPWYHCAPTGTNSSLGLEPDYKFFQVSRRNQAEILQKCFV